MLSADELVKLLGYADSACFRTQEQQFEPEAVQLFRMAREQKEDNFHVKGFYVLRTANQNGTPASWAARPAVCVAEAQTASDAKKLHRRIWNLGSVPFLVVRLPNEVRVYAGFHYEHDSDAGVIFQENDEQKLSSTLSDFTAASIDSTRIWQAQHQYLNTKHRVDSTLLRNLGNLAQALARHCSPVLELSLAHALIGKFVYLRYLRDRNILDDRWLAKHTINLGHVFGPSAKVSELARLTDALETRFNGDVFHIDFGSKCPLTDAHVQLVASVFAGDEIYVGAIGIAQQLHLEFLAYDFRHIPVETLSSIYEQFLHAQQKGKSDGAYYTPEVLADYLISEINSVTKLQPGMTICDPACGSGVFLVLAYRRLIELEMAKPENRQADLGPMRLREILMESIYGVERHRDACNVTMFSLILTLLNYVEPPELHANEKFRFPALLNKRIFCFDFFDPKLPLAAPKKGFDVIVGNPPWVELNPHSRNEDHARQWIANEEAIAGNRVADAFAVKAGRLLSADGVAGMLLPATTLLTLEGKKFRQAFFTEFAVSRITNLANLRGNLFGKRAILPTTTLVFRKADALRLGQPIVHYGPFAANQIAGSTDDLWLLTIHGSEIQQVMQRDAVTGETSVWKLALWGTPRDARALERIQKLYPLSLARFCEGRGWGKRMPREGAQLRSRSSQEKLVRCKELEGQKRFDSDKFNQLIKGGLHFSFPKGVLVDIPDDQTYVRKRGGLSGLAINHPPHLLISATWKNFLLFSEDYFAVPPRQIGISASPGKHDSETLRALAVYLASSLVDFALFFHVPEWGIYSTFPHIVLRAVRNIPTPDFTDRQIAMLAAAHRELQREERAFRLESPDLSSATEKQRLIDKIVFEAIEVPSDVCLLVEDFRDNRLPLDNGAAALKKLGKRPTVKELQAYGRTLRDELERFLLNEAQPCIRIFATDDLICCELQLLPADAKQSQTIGVVTASDNSKARDDIRRLREQLSERFSQWAYVDRSLRVFGDDVAQTFKAPRLMDWTRTQALNDADVIIAEILADVEKSA